MSQSELARVAGCNHSYVSRLETGSRHPSTPAIVRRLADALALNPDARADLMIAAGFVPDNGTTEAVPAEVRELLDVLYLLDDDTRVRVLDSISLMTAGLILTSQATSLRPASRSPRPLAEVSPAWTPTTRTGRARPTPRPRS